MVWVVSAKKEKNHLNLSTVKGAKLAAQTVVTQTKRFLFVQIFVSLQLPWFILRITGIILKRETKTTNWLTTIKE